MVGALQEAPRIAGRVKRGRRAILPYHIPLVDWTVGAVRQVIRMREVYWFHEIHK